MAKNKLQDLNDHLFAQIERLNDEDIKPEDMKIELEKAKAMGNLAKQVVEINKIEVDKAKFLLDAFDKGLVKDFDVSKNLLLE